jgi:lipopolysaccharide/colanic/teichoic acid biosynthesis glycosyltransferase
MHRYVLELATDAAPAGGEPRQAVTGTQKGTENAPSCRPLHSLVKRCFDFAVSLVGFLLLLPVVLGIGILVLLTSGRPILFWQDRVGHGGKLFRMCKFRTMTHDAAASKGSFDLGHTRRVTPVGKVLRATKLDELPQLWNVLIGDMSLVGPRPEVRRWVDAYPERWARVHRVKPGITDPASIVYRDEEKLLAASEDPQQTYRDVILPHKLDLYEDYVGNQSLGGDLGILVRTVLAVVFRR